MTRYISAKDAAKMVRKDLKSKFPNVKFSVRSDTYSGGASLRISYVDGPLKSEVEKVTNVYAGSRFDGMIDMKTSAEHYITKEGKVILANVTGTEGQRGSLPSVNNEMPEGAERVSFLSDYVFVEREYTVEMMQRSLDKVRSKCHITENVSEITVTTGYMGFPKLSFDPYISEWSMNLSEMVRKDLSRRTNVKHV